MITITVVCSHWCYGQVIDARATMAVYRLYKNRSANHPKKAAAAETRSKGRADTQIDTIATPISIGSTDMPFTESKNALRAYPDDESEADEHSQSATDRLSLLDTPTNLYGSSTPLKSGSKKRKRARDSSADPPLVLHVASDASKPSSIPPPASNVSEKTTHKMHKAPTMSTKKISKRIAAGKSSSRSTTEYPGGGRKGISSGLSTVVRSNGAKRVTGKGASDSRPRMAVGSAGASDWWTKL